MMKDFIAGSLQSQTDMDRIIRKFQNSYRGLKRYEIANHGYLPLGGVVFDIFSELRFLDIARLYRKEALKLATQFDDSGSVTQEKANSSLHASKIIFNFVAMSLLHNVRDPKNKLDSNLLCEGILATISQASGAKGGNAKNKKIVVSSLRLNGRTNIAISRQEAFAASLLRDAAALSYMFEGKRSILDRQMATKVAQTFARSLIKQTPPQLIGALKL